MYIIHCSHQRMRLVAFFAVWLWVMGLGFNEGSVLAEIPASQGKNVSASTVTSATYDASKAVDGLWHTAWRPGSDSLPQWLTVDLGQTVSVQRVETLYENPYSYYQYRIETSLDGLNWSVFADRASNTAGSFPQYIDSGQAAARYVRITTTGVGTPGDTASIYQFDVYSAPSSLVLLSQGKTAIAYSTFGPGWEAGKAVDGSLATRWAPSSAPLPQWLVVDLGQAAGVQRVETTYSQKDEAYRYKLEFSSDGITWYTFADRTSNTLRNEPRYVDYGNATARYVRHSTTGLASGAGLFSLAELEIYGLGSGTGQQASPTGVIFDEASYSLVQGSTRTVVLSARYPDQRTVTVSSGIAYTSSNPAVVTVSASGLLTAAATGTATITAAYNGITASAAVTVTPQQPAALSSIYFDSYHYQVAPYSHSNVTVTGSYANGTTANVTASAAYTSSNTSVASVSSDGRIQGWSAGTAYLTASYGGQTATSTVTVNSQLSSISVNTSYVSLTVGGTKQLAVTGYRSDGTATTVSGAQFTTSQSSVAAVDSSGYVSGVAAGSATITITYEGLTTTASVTVTGGVDQAAPQWAEGSSLQVSQVTATEATLSWNGATDQVGVTAYRLYNGDTELTTLVGDILSYRVTGLSPEMSYSFRVEAGDAAQQWSSSGPTAYVEANRKQAAPLPLVQPQALPPAQGLVIQGQMVQEFSPNGAGTFTKVTVDPQQWELAADSAESGSGILLTIEAPSDLDTAELVIPAASLERLMEGSPDDAIAVRTASASVTIPFRLLQKVMNQEQASELTVMIRQAKGSEVGLTNQLTAQAKLQRRLLPNPLEVLLLVNGVEVPSFEGMYLEHTVTLTQGPVTGQATAIWLDLTNGRFGFVPSHTKETNGVWHTVLKAPHGGMYTVVEGSKQFEDLKGHWSQRDIEKLASKGIISGVSEKQFNPDAEITRAQFAALLVRSLGLEQDISTRTIAFSDVTSGDWFAASVAAAVKAGLILGYEDGTFRPLNQITREQMAVMVLRAMQIAQTRASLAPPDAVLAKYKDQSNVASWARDALAFNLHNGLMQWIPSTQLLPQANTTRAQAGTTLSRLLERIQYLN